MQFFLTHLGGYLIILGYPWFAAMEPHITWSKGWIDYDHLPVMLLAPPIAEQDPEERTLTDEFKELDITVMTVKERCTTALKLVEQHQKAKMTTLLEEYQ